MSARSLAAIALLAALVGGAWYAWSWATETVALNDPALLAEMRSDAAAQDETVVPRHLGGRTISQRNPLRNLYFGDLHVHTSLSFDSYLMGNRFDLDDAYHFANGAELTLISGETAALSRPLDFVALTDHAESFALEAQCGTGNRSANPPAVCAMLDTPSRLTFLQLRRQAQIRPPVRSADMCTDPASCLRLENSTWARIRESAERHNQPGNFTAFVAYEYSPVLSEAGKLHRNVIFRSAQVPDHATNAFDAATVLDLWQALERDCVGDCQVLTIPHNMNKTWGLAYSGYTIDGDPYRNEDWALRGRSEPLAEIYQVKGASECAVGAGSTDEQCGFEQMMRICGPDETVACGGPHSYARQGLKRGLELQQELGFNPLRFGLVAATDNHNGTPGDTEEWDFRGSVATISGTAKRRLAQPPMNYKSGIARSPGGLTAAWAVENTRGALFDAMQRREVYGTSGTRIQLRFFAGVNLPRTAAQAADPVAVADANGVPMGQLLPVAEQPPVFFVAAAQDAFSAPLQRIQMVKGWLQDGVAQEAVVDIICADGLVPSAGRCPDNGAVVDLATCAFSADRGASELRTTWVDPDFDPAQAAFYYVRVLENPSCRWSTWDALRLGREPRDDVPPLVQERAWSSPIWTQPAA